MSVPAGLAARNRITGLDIIDLTHLAELCRRYGIGRPYDKPGWRSALQTSSRPASGVLHDPGVLAAASLRRVDHVAAALERDARQAAGQDPWALARRQDVRPQIDAAGLDRTAL